MKFNRSTVLSFKLSLAQFSQLSIVTESLPFFSSDHGLPKIPLADCDVWPGFSQSTEWRFSCFSLPFVEKRLSVVFSSPPNRHRRYFSARQIVSHQNGPKNDSDHIGATEHGHFGSGTGSLDIL
jgi:hypothetical protein